MLWWTAEDAKQLQTGRIATPPKFVPCHRDSEDNVCVKPDAEYLKNLLSASRNAPPGG